MSLRDYRAATHDHILRSTIAPDPALQREKQLAGRRQMAGRTRGARSILRQSRKQTTTDTADIDTDIGTAQEISSTNQTNQKVKQNMTTTEENQKRERELFTNTHAINAYRKGWGLEAAGPPFIPPPMNFKRNTSAK